MPARLLLRAATDDGDVVQTQLALHLGEVRGALQQRLDEGKRDVGARNGQWDAGQPGAGADVGDGGGVVKCFGDHRTVEDVPFPQAADFFGADEAALGGGGGERFVVGLGEWQAVAEDGGGGCG